jgi:hypothetical protein
MQHILWLRHWEFMPRYFFDVHSETTILDDEDGTELDGIDSAREAALAYLGETAMHELSHPKQDRLAIHVRDEGGETVLTASLWVQAKAP